MLTFLHVPDFDVWKCAIFLQGNSQAKMENQRESASFPKCLMTRHNQGIGKGGQHPEAIIQAGPQRVNQPNAQEVVWAVN